MKNILLILLLTVCLCPISAQGELDTINSIKMSGQYLYATGTSTVSEEDATNIANDLLLMEIEEWLKSVAKDDISGYIAKSKEQLGEIKTRRGKLYRSFAYVDKRSIQTCYGDEDIMVVGLSESWKADTTRSMGSVTPKYELTNFEESMLAITTFDSLNEFILSRSEDNTIVDKGKYASRPKDGMYYLFVYNKSGIIPACLKVNGETIMNLQTKDVDNIANYKGCGAIWIKINNYEK